MSILTSISQRFLSRLFLPQAVAAMVIASSLSLIAMDWDGEFRPYVGPAAHAAAAQEQDEKVAAESLGQTQEDGKPAQGQVLTLKEDGSAPDGYVLVDELLARKRAHLAEKVRITKLAIKTIENLPGMERYKMDWSVQLAADAALLIEDGLSGMNDGVQGLIDLLQGGIKKRVLKQERAAPLLQGYDKIEEGLARTLQSTVRMAKAVGRFDVIAELEQREMTQEGINAMRWHKTKKVLNNVVLPMGAVAVCVAAIIWPSR